MNILKFLRTNFLLAAALLTAGITMSFKTAESKAVNTVFYYNSSDLSEGAFATTANWSSSISAACLSSGARPCKMTVPTGSTLGAQIGGKTNTQVLAIHPTERRP